MLEEHIDIFNLPFDTDVDAICITTNKFIKSNGRAVMGRGIAKKYNDLSYGMADSILGNIIKNEPKHGLGIMGMIGKVYVVAFPVKPDTVICYPDKSNIVEHAKNKFNEGDAVPGFFAKAQLHLIFESLVRLRELIHMKNWNKVLLPYPGCGAGELSWEMDVKPYITNMEFEDNRIIFVTL